MDVITVEQPLDAVHPLVDDMDRVCLQYDVSGTQHGACVELPHVEVMHLYEYVCI